MDLKNPGLPDRYRLRALAAPLSTPLPMSILPMPLTLSPGSWNRLIALISTIHRLSGISPPSLERRPNPPGRTRYLKKTEWLKLKKILLLESPLLEQAARFTLATGLRENNVLELKWDEVDLKRKHIYLAPSRMKNRQALGIPLNPDAMKVLRERKGENKEWVFAHPWTQKPLVKASNKAWYKAVKEAGLKGFRWHDLRHTWASWAVRGGVSMRVLMELGGWKSYSMVARYSHLAPDHLAEAAARIKPV